MWLIGLVGMALKTTEVSLSMLYRNTDDPENPRGGPMWVAKFGFQELGGFWPKIAGTVGGIFCVTVLISAVTGGNMFQSWNVAEVTYDYFGVPKIMTGVILAVVVGAVIIGGIKRIGAVAGRMVPLMCGLYLVAGLVVIFLNLGQVPAMFGLIFKSAFSATEAGGAFLGGTFGYTFLWGMKRALFSNEAGQGSAPIAHAAAKTDEPIREGILAGLGPFIDTIVVCTVTALVILLSGTWNRAPEATFIGQPQFTQTENGSYTLEPVAISSNDFSAWQTGEEVAVVVSTVDRVDTGSDRDFLYGRIERLSDGTIMATNWGSVASDTVPQLAENGRLRHLPWCLDDCLFIRSKYPRSRQMDGHVGILAFCYLDDDQLELLRGTGDRLPFWSTWDRALQSSLLCAYYRSIVAYYHYDYRTR